MNGNFKYTLTDEQRNILKRKLTGKSVKGLVSRADVCALLQKHLDGLLNGKPIGDKVADAMRESIAQNVNCSSCEAECHPSEISDGVCDTCRDKGFAPPCFEQRDFDDFTREEIEQIVTQNKLLIGRVNRLQHRLDLEVAS